ncbi:MAG: metallophosphoesterase [Oscillospiraceae bacterium]|nr:metallophosphoesterase [Oscillospiraceae bacterium]
MGKDFLKRALAILLSISVIVSFIPATSVFAVDEQTTVLAFTSDVHNLSNNVSADRLGKWIDMVKAKYGKLDAMGFCGDLAQWNASESDYWTYTQAVMSKVEEKGVTAVYTTGNHEYDPGAFTPDKNDEARRFIENAEAPVEGNYHIYCIGSGSGWGNYSVDGADSQLGKLNAFFEGLNSDDNKPVFIVTHFPLHYWAQGGRLTHNAGLVIDRLNHYATNDTPND